jgi:hypothetical protein
MQRNWPLADGMLGRLRRAAAGDQDVAVGPVRGAGPEQMVLGAMTVLIAPLVTSPIEARNGWRIGMRGVERFDRIRHARR